MANQQSDAQHEVPLSKENVKEFCGFFDALYLEGKITLLTYKKSTRLCELAALALSETVAQSATTPLLDDVRAARDNAEREANALREQVAHWKRMYECAQNANSYRQDALDK